MNASLTLLDAIHQRRAVRHFEPQHQIPRATLREMLQHTLKTPSSINLQPWRFIVLDTPESKAKLNGLVRSNQRLLDTCSAMVVIIADIDHMPTAPLIYDQAVQQGFMPRAVADGYLQHVMHYQNTLSRAQIQQRAVIDGALAAMQFMLIAEAYGYATCPIGGFQHQETLKALCLDTVRYAPVMLVAVGKAQQAGHDSYRLPLDCVLAFEDGALLKAL